MSTSNPLFMGDVKDGKLTLREPQTVLRYLKGIEGPVELIIRKHRKKRTDKQNAYYWAAIVPVLAEYLSRVGRRLYSLEDAHSVAKLEFNPKVVLDLKGTSKVIPGSTADLDSFQFTLYIERIVQWGAESGLTFPTSEEYYQNG